MQVYMARIAMWGGWISFNEVKLLFKSKVTQSPLLRGSGRFLTSVTPCGLCFARARPVSSK